MLSQRYDAPSGKVGQHFVVALMEELRGVRDIRWNLERFIIFQTVIMQRARHITASQAIHCRKEKRLDAWEAGRHGMLVEETLRICAQYLTSACREESEEHRDKTCHSLVIRGKLQTAVMWIIAQD